ncbi:MAG: hypothetical protein GY794_23935, partial [bacterium]|nr:hypothetical protein [bacterium]
MIVFCGCQRNAALESKDSGFGFMLNPDVYSANLCGFELAELGTHELQRIGRGNRRTTKTNVVCLIPDNSKEVVMDALRFAAMVDAAKEGAMP